MMEVCNLSDKNCKPCEGGVAPLSASEAQELLRHIQGWALHEKHIEKIYSFSNYYQTMAFVNAAAWVSHQENDHPELHITYKQCAVIYTTTAINGLSENDFICAAKIDALIIK
jgi:4a-hydroxytetrahydrobiopterin dehydratase